MKKQFTTLIIFAFLLLFSARISAQITLEYTIDSITIGDEFYCTDIGNNDFKYVLLDPVLNEFHLYNMNMTPYMAVHIPVVGDSIKNGFIVTYITKSLFDCDSSNIEYVYEAPYFGLHTFYIYRTDGTLLFKEDSARGPYVFGSGGGSHDIRPIMNTSDGTKLFLMYSYYYRIYSLCGTLPTTVYDFAEHNQFVKIYPNPTAMLLNFEINLPNNQDDFQLTIFDNNAKEQKRESLTLTGNKYSLDVSNMANGTYFFSLISKNKIYQTGKFILTK